MAKVLTLNDANSSSPVKLSEDDILFGVVSGSNSSITYKDGTSSINKVIEVTETLANIAGASDNLSAGLTDEDSKVLLIDRRRVTNLYESTDVVLIYDMNTASDRRFVLSDTYEAASLVLAGDPTEYEVASYTATEIVLAAGEGDVTGTFVASTVINVVGSGANDGIYSVASSAFGAETTITLNEAIVDAASTDGTVYL